MLGFKLNVPTREVRLCISLPLTLTLTLTSLALLPLLVDLSRRKKDVEDWVQKYLEPEIREIIGNDNFKISVGVEHGDDWIKYYDISIT